MKYFSLIVCFIILMYAPALASDKIVIKDLTSIRVIDLSETEQSRDEIYAAFNVLDDLGLILLTFPGPSDNAMLTKMNLDSAIVDIQSKDHEFYVVSLRDLDLKTLSAAVSVLYAIDDIALISATHSEAFGLKRKVHHFSLEEGVRLLDLNLYDAPKTLVQHCFSSANNRAHDPRIQALVDNVVQNNIQDTVQDLENMGERKASSGGFTAETYLVNKFNSIGGLVVSTHSFSSVYSDNVVAELPGVVDPSVIFVVGGHYDSTSYSGLAPGADDNGSGTACVVEIARVLSKSQFKYPIRLIAFGAEELGLLGSEAYCDDLVINNADVQGMINLDMTAYRKPTDPYDVGFITNNSSSSFIEFCSGVFKMYVPALGITKGTLSAGTSDHQSFTSHGYTACFPFEDLSNYSPHIHTTNDIVGVSANDFLLAKMITQGALASLVTLASPIDLDIKHTPLQNKTNASGPYVVNADVSSLIGTTVTKVSMVYDLGAGAITKEMAYTGSGDSFISSIPGKADAGNVEYYFDAEDNMGNTERLPDGLGNQTFKFFVGHLNDVFNDDFEINDNGWSHAGSGQDDWMRDTPTGNGGYDPAQASSGAKVWGNDLGIGSYNGNYQPNVNSYLESPPIDCTGVTGVFLRYSRWLTVEEAIYDKASILINNNQVFLNALNGDHIDTEWLLHEIDISAYADNNPAVRVRFTLTTDGGKELGGWNIDDLHVGTQSNGDLSALSCSEVYIMASKGGTIGLSLNGDLGMAYRQYLIGASVSGTSPGIPVNGLILPLNWDVLTTYCFANLNSPTFDNFMGTLNQNGEGTASFVSPPIPLPTLIGMDISLAWISIKPIDYVSNPVNILIVP